MKRFLLVSLSVATMAAVVLVDEMRPAAQGQGQGLALGRPEVLPAVHHDVSRPLRDMPILPVITTRPDFEVLRPPMVERGGQDTAVQSIAVAPFPARFGLSFPGVGASGYAPPDTVGEAGPNHYVQWVNVRFAIYDKNGSLLQAPVGGNTLWAGFGGDCEARNDGDPIVQYDQLEDRWIMTQFAVRQGNYLQCVAISKTGDPTGEYYRYAFSYADFPDYPKLGVWPDAYYITFNMFRNGRSFTGGRACAYEKAAMLTGGAARQVCFQGSAASLLPADLDGSTPPPPGTPNYIVNRGSNAINVWKFSVNWNNPQSSTFTGPTAVPVAGFSIACGGGACIPQPGTSTKLDSLGDRLMYRLAYRNLAGSERLLVNHSVTSGTATAIRWYELGVTGGTPVRLQQGTYAPDSNYRWMGSIAMDHAGNIAVGYSVSNGTSIKPSIRFAGRVPTDPDGLLGLETEMKPGSGSQTGTLQRWGDYSTLSIDPSDDCTFWFTSEYLDADGSFNWKTNIGSFKFASCGGTATPDFSLAATPSSQDVVQGSSASYTVSASATGGFSADVAMSVTGGLPTGATAQFTPSSIAGNNGSSTLDVTTNATTTPPGNYTLTITGTSGSGQNALTHTTSVALHVTAAPTPDFSVAISPTSQSVLQGAIASYDVTVTPLNGYAGPPSLTNSGPGTLGAQTSNGGVWTSTLTVDTASLSGTYPLTVTATDGPLQHSASATLTVTPPAGADFSISVSPGARNIRVGQDATYTVTIGGSGGFAGDVDLSVSGNPGTVSFSQNPITGGSGSSTLTISNGAKGSYTLTITATSGSLTHSTTVSLRIR